jgi:hypothetical protein
MTQTANMRIHGDRELLEGTVFNVKPYRDVHEQAAGVSPLKRRVLPPM